MSQPAGAHSPLTAHDSEILTPRPRPERARMLLHGDCGPLLRMSVPLTDEVIAAAYLAYLAWIRARIPQPRGFLSGRPAYEAHALIGSRIRVAARRSGSLADWGRELFERCKLRIGELRTEDALWWLETQRALAHRWRALNTDSALSEVAVSLRLLDEWMRLVPALETPLQRTPDTDGDGTLPIASLTDPTTPEDSHGA